MSTMPTCSHVEYLRKRGKCSYLRYNGERVRVTFGALTQIEFGYAGNRDDYLSFTVGYDNIIYRDSDSELTDGATFYPYATDVEAELVNEILAVAVANR